MDNQDIISALHEGRNKTVDEEETQFQETVKYLVFLAGERRLAVLAEHIREIVIDLPLFYVPFVPTYVRGFINRHGEPFTVLDLNVLFDQKLLESETFLVTSDTSNPTAFLITDVLEILKVHADEVHNITSRDDDQQFVSGSISDPKGSEILILDLPEIFKRLERDIG
jgi:purine-binding chemotaxis protein CheW